MLGVVAVVGTGLIGASAGLAANAAGAERVRGWDPDPDTLRVAAQRGAVEPADSLEEAVADADLVLVAAPVASVPSAVRA
ncbi:MAG: NAD(P)-binding domain-containing protein, partial [Gaiellaceae bacterium]